MPDNAYRHDVFYERERIEMIKNDIDRIWSTAWIDCCGDVFKEIQIGGTSE